MNASLRRAFAVAALWASSVSSLSAAELVANIFDPDGIGFNNSDPVEPVGGNPGTTRGEQRMNVLLRAFEIMNASLGGSVPIVVQLRFAQLSCQGGGAVLASASASRHFADFPGAPREGVLYPAALANFLAGEDLTPGPPDPIFAGQPFSDDLTIQINDGIDSNPNCLGANGWYYGLDHQEQNQPDLLAVLLHEIIHGLGFTTTVNPQGNLLMGLPDIATTFIFDLEMQKSWPEMDRLERLASSVNNPDVVWTGPEVTGRLKERLRPEGRLQVEAPEDTAGTFPAQNASFGPLAPFSGIGGRVVTIDDGDDAFGTRRDACQPLINGDEVKGQIALIERGDCEFVLKTLNAQQAGARAVLIYNNIPVGLPPMGGSSNQVDIPALGISRSLGLALLDQSEAQATAGLDPNNFSGTNQGLVRMHAPDPFQAGSSISHWTTDTFPNLLMEPAINGSLTDDLDLTLPFLRDLGWETVETRPRISGPRPNRVRSQ